MSRRRKKKPLEFSQKIVLLCVILVAFLDFATVVCAWFGRQAFDAVTIAMINAVIPTALGGYYAQNTISRCSVNKMNTAKSNTEETTI
jgi:high-affinity K+ transport system ATPase subunit B